MLSFFYSLHNINFLFLLIIVSLTVKECKKRKNNRIRDIEGECNADLTHMCVCLRREEMIGKCWNLCSNISIEISWEGTSAGRQNSVRVLEHPHTAPIIYIHYT